ncbi:hypothetical protein [Bosea sp. 117]|uniref:hypothetical protein n=1 Tax=Bosea sp. 117 TaxID=1125973 RepID=UPI000493CF13|nr:hypothetical protein [Bosea sp. 117]
MLSTLFWALMVAGSAAVAVLWVFAAKFGYDLLRAAQAGGTGEATAGRWAALPFWPFAARGLSTATPEEAQRLNKMMVGVIAAILVAAGSAAVYSNLTFVPPAQTQQ